MSLNRRRFLNSSMALAVGSALTPFSLSHGQVEGVRPAPGMPAPTMVPTNGINMAVYEQGSGPAVIFCHGFPELAFSWRNQLGAIADAGYHAIAPDQRGYGMTGGPDDPMQYDMGIFCEDLVGMMDAKGIDKAVFVGHDWGGAVVWAMGVLHPDRCLGIIGPQYLSRAPG